MTGARAERGAGAWRERASGEAKRLARRIMGGDDDEACSLARYSLEKIGAVAFAEGQQSANRYAADICAGVRHIVDGWEQRVGHQNAYVDGLLLNLRNWVAEGPRTSGEGREGAETPDDQLERVKEQLWGEGCEMDRGELRGVFQQLLAFQSEVNAALVEVLPVGAPDSPPAVDRIRYLGATLAAQQEMIRQLRDGLTECQSAVRECVRWNAERFDNPEVADHYRKMLARAEATLKEQP